jgi:hypothetical protein
MAASLVRRFNHEPISFLKDRFHAKDKHDGTLEAISTIQRVFNLK